MLRSLLLACLLLASSAEAETLEIGLSRDQIGITSSFDGTQMTVFGTIEGEDPATIARTPDGPGSGYDIIVTLTGPLEPVIVRRKERAAGIWVNGSAQLFVSVPSFYATASTRPLESMTSPAQLKLLQIGPRNLDFPPRGLVLPPAEREEFRLALARLRLTDDLFSRVDGSVTMLSPTLFRATFAVPANIPIGTHTAQAYLFRDGDYLNSATASLSVAKQGFEQVTYRLAHENGFLYGLLAVLVAITTGWLASVAFRKD